MTDHFDSTPAEYFPAEQLEPALRSAARDDCCALEALFIENSPPAYREWIAAEFARLRKNSGRPKAKRNPEGLTETQEAKADGYEAYHDALDSGLSHEDADRKAINSDARFARLQPHVRLRIYDNGETPVNNILRKRGTFRHRT